MATKEAETRLSDLTQAPPGGWTFELVVASGPDAGKALVVDGATPRRLIGKSALCHLSIDDAEISRRHATVESTASGLHVQDLGSKNGTFLSGVRIASAFALGGETLRVGQTEVSVVRRSDEQAQLARAMRFGRVIGASAAMRKLYPILKRLAESDVPVVLEGATGTGKELLAETLHEEGTREAGAFSILDCAALSAAESEQALFGDASGRAGLLEQANGGTLFLDEIGELDGGVQGKLLGVIERGKVTRGADTVAVDIRFIASTRRDLEVEVQEGRLREDLYFRLAVAHVELPPLRERQGDVELLVRHFWTKLGGRGDLSSATMARLERSDWPGNVRELRNAVARLIAVGDDAPALAASKDAPTAVLGDFDHVLRQDLTLPVARQKVVDAFEHAYIERALAKSGGNVSAAAAAAGIARRYFYVVKNRVGSGER